MTRTQKIIFTIVIVLTIGLLGFIIKYQFDLLAKQKAIESSLIESKKLQEQIVRAEAKYVTKNDLEQFAKDMGLNLKPIKSDLKKLEAEIQGISRTDVETPGYVGTYLPSTDTTPREEPPGQPTVTCPSGETVPCPDQHGYLVERQELELNEPFGEGVLVPWGKAGFSAWEKKPWDLEVYARRYTAATVLSTDENGRHFVHNQFTVTVGGDTYQLPIARSQFVERYPESEFRFGPNLFLGIDGGLSIGEGFHSAWMPNMQVSLFSYGKTKVNPEWTFLGIGVGYGIRRENIAAIVSPVNYNLGKAGIPLVDNLHIGPSISLDTAGNFGAMLGIRVGL